MNIFMDLRLYYLYYLLFINLLGFLLMGIDKHKARHKKWRIPEKTLFVSAILGGSVGSLAGMYIFRHKTKHKSFTIGMPAILIIHILILISLYCFTKGIY